MKPMPSSWVPTRFSVSASDTKAKGDLGYSLKLRISRIRSMLPQSSRWVMLEPKASVRSIPVTGDRCTAVFHGFGSLHFGKDDNHVFCSDAEYFCGRDFTNRSTIPLSLPRLSSRTNLS